MEILEYLPAGMSFGTTSLWRWSPHFLVRSSLRSLTQGTGEVARSMSLTHFLCCSVLGNQTLGVVRPTRHGSGLSKMIVIFGSFWNLLQCLLNLTWLCTKAAWSLLPESCWTWPRTLLTSSGLCTKATIKATLLYSRWRCTKAYQHFAGTIPGTSGSVTGTMITGKRL